MWCHKQYRWWRKCHVSASVYCLLFAQSWKKVISLDIHRAWTRGRLKLVQISGTQVRRSVPFSIFPVFMFFCASSRPAALPAMPTRQVSLCFPNCRLACSLFSVCFFLSFIFAAVQTVGSAGPHETGAVSVSQCTALSLGRSNCGTLLCCFLLVTFDFFHFHFCVLCPILLRTISDPPPPSPLSPPLPPVVPLAIQLLCANETNRWSLNYTFKWMADPSGWATAAYRLCAVFTSYWAVWLFIVWVTRSLYFPTKPGTLVLYAPVMPTFWSQHVYIW